MHIPSDTFSCKKCSFLKKGINKVKNMRIIPGWEVQSKFQDFDMNWLNRLARASNSVKREMSSYCTCTIEWYPCIQWGAHTCFLRWVKQLTQHMGGQVCCCFKTLRVLGDVVKRHFFQNHFPHIYKCDHHRKIMSCTISSENDTIWRMLIGGMMELYGDGFSMLKCISMLIVSLLMSFQRQNQDAS